MPCGFQPDTISADRASTMAAATLARMAVVIPCFNAAPWIGKTIDSVLAQAYPGLVLIVVDDGSSDESAERVRAYGDRVILSVGPNRGACSARNTGMRIARDNGADYVLFLDADDYHEGAMLVGAGRVAAESGADIVLSDMHEIYEDKRRNARSLYTGRVDPATFFGGWLEGRYFNPSAIVWRIDFVERIGGWDESLARNQDMDIALRAMFEEPFIVKNDDGIAVHARVNPDSVSRTNTRKTTDSRMRVHIGLIERAHGTRFATFIPLMQHKLYSLTRLAFQTGHPDLGRQGVAAMRRNGFRKHPGSPTHSLISHLIGLEAKVRLWGN